MRKAIQYVQSMSVEDAVSLGFDSFEVRFEDMQTALYNDSVESSKDIADRVSGSGGKIIGVVVNGLETADVRAEDRSVTGGTGGGNKSKAAVVDAETMKSCIDRAAACGAYYVVVDTRGMETLCGLAEVLSEVLGYAVSAGVRIYIENGYVCRNGVHYHTESSDTAALCRLVEGLNRKAKESNTGGENMAERAAAAEDINGEDSVSQFGICINVGYANLLGINVSQFITECGKHLAVMHMNDNNGISDQQQMPYTFTTGRGINSTDWYHIIGALYKLKFEGAVVFDTAGTFKRTPVRLHRAMIELLNGIYGEWEECFNIEKRLGKSGKRLVLFGAGKMIESYMDAFGEKYPPEFLVDNNSKLWGTKRLGFEVKKPEEILEIPQDQRNVWICNTYYDAIGLQLDKMGVEYSCYFDHYYL